MRALTADPRELARLIFGRLGYFKTCTAASLATAARNDPEFYPAPRWPCLWQRCLLAMKMRSARDCCAAGRGSAWAGAGGSGDAGGTASMVRTRRQPRDHALTQRCLLSPTIPD